MWFTRRGGPAKLRTSIHSTSSCAHFKNETFSSKKEEQNIFCVQVRLAFCNATENIRNFIEQMQIMEINHRLHD